MSEWNPIPPSLIPCRDDSATGLAAPLGGEEGANYIADSGWSDMSLPGSAVTRPTRMFAPSRHDVLHGDGPPAVRSELPDAGHNRAPGATFATGTLWT